MSSLSNNWRRKPPSQWSPKSLRLLPRWSTSIAASCRSSTTRTGLVFLSRHSTAKPPLSLQAWGLLLCHTVQTEHYFIRFSLACERLKAVAVLLGNGFIFRSGRLSILCRFHFETGVFSCHLTFFYIYFFIFLFFKEGIIVGVYKHNDEHPF